MPDAGVAVRRDEADERAAAVGVSRPVRPRRLRAAVLHGVRPAPAPRHGDREVHRARSRDGRAITLFGDGSSRRDYTFIDDIVAGTVAAIERVEPGRYEIFNLGGTHTISLRELVAIIERVVGKRAIDRAATRSARRRADHVRERRSRARGARLCPDHVDRARGSTVLGLAPPLITAARAGARSTST